MSGQEQKSGHPVDGSDPLQEIELREFAEQYGMPLGQVKDLISRVGNSRAALEAAMRLLTDNPDEARTSGRE